MGVAGKALQEPGLGTGIKVQIQIQAVNEGDRRALAGINAALNQPQPK